MKSVWPVFMYTLKMLLVVFYGITYPLFAHFTLVRLGFEGEFLTIWLPAIATTVLGGGGIYYFVLGWGYDPDRKNRLLADLG